MNLIILISSLIFSLFATAIMTYVSMATPIGPWVELIIVLASTMFFRIVCGYIVSERLKNAVGLVTAAAGVAGIVATVCGFTFPTLYFLDQNLFTHWMANPWQLTALIGGAIMIGGGIAFVMADFFGERMLANEQLTFPIGQMVHKMIVAQNQLRKAIELFAGLFAAFFYASAQRYFGFIPHTLVFAQRTFGNLLTIPKITIGLDFLPLFVAIGYVAGDILAVPLGVGVLSKLFLLAPLTGYTTGWLATENSESFILAFGAGMMIQGALLSFVKVPHLFVSTWGKLSSGEISLRRRWRWQTLAGVALLLCMTYGYFNFFNFSLFAQLYMLGFTAICVYQLMIIGGKIGLAPFGRFATFVMLPGFFMFGYDSIQITLVSLLVSLSGGIAVDLLFGRKMAQLTDINRRSIFWMQLLGLVVSAVAFSYIFTVLAQHFGIGSAELVAQRARARALLINVHHFNYLILALGGLYGFLLERFSVNPLLVFTGLLFPVDYSLMLIAGGLLTYVAQDKEEWDPFWSGVFAATSLWMVLRGFL